MHYLEILNAIEIKLAGQSFFKPFDDLYTIITREFNNYSKNNDLGIDLQFILFSSENTTTEWDSYSNTMETLLSKKLGKYDMIIYDPVLTRKFSPHFIDLKKWMSPEHLQLYSGDPEKLGIYNNRWVGLVYNKY